MSSGRGCAEHSFEIKSAFNMWIHFCKPCGNNCRRWAQAAIINTQLAHILQTIAGDELRQPPSTLHGVSNRNYGIPGPAFGGSGNRLQIRKYSTRLGARNWDHLWVEIPGWTVGSPTVRLHLWRALLSLTKRSHFICQKWNVSNSRFLVTCVRMISMQFRHALA